MKSINITVDGIPKTINVPEDATPEEIDEIVNTESQPQKEPEKPTLPGGGGGESTPMGRTIFPLASQFKGRGLGSSLARVASGSLIDAPTLPLRGALGAVSYGIRKLAGQEPSAEQLIGKSALAPEAEKIRQQPDWETDVKPRYNPQTGDYETQMPASSQKEILASMVEAAPELGLSALPKLASKAKEGVSTFGKIISPALRSKETLKAEQKGLALTLGQKLRQGEEPGSAVLRAYDMLREINPFTANKMARRYVALKDAIKKESDLVVSKLGGKAKPVERGHAFVGELDRAYKATSKKYSDMLDAIGDTQKSMPMNTFQIVDDIDGVVEKYAVPGEKGAEAISETGMKVLNDLKEKILGLPDDPTGQLYENRSWKGLKNIRQTFREKTGLFENKKTYTPTEMKAFDEAYDKISETLKNSIADPQLKRAYEEAENVYAITRQQIGDVADKSGIEIAMGVAKTEKPESVISKLIASGSENIKQLSVLGPKAKKQVASDVFDEISEKASKSGFLNSKLFVKEIDDLKDKGIYELVFEPSQKEMIDSFYRFAQKLSPTTKGMAKGDIEAEAVLYAWDRLIDAFQKGEWGKIASQGVATAALAPIETAKRTGKVITKIASPTKVGLSAGGRTIKRRKELLEEPEDQSEQPEQP